MKKFLPAVVLTLSLCAILPTTNVFANNGGDNRPTLRPHQALNIPSPANSQAGQGGNWFTNLWDAIKDFFGGHHHNSGSGGATSGGGATAGGSGSAPAAPSGPAGGAGSPAPSGPSGAPAAPIDGGLSLLLVAGAGLGVKKMRDSYKNKKND